MQDGKLDAATREDRKALDVARVVYLMATMSPDGVQRLRMFAEGVDSAEHPLTIAAGRPVQP
jgi:hypothetical protein